MRINFTNDAPYPCGCRVVTHGSDGIYCSSTEVHLCKKHSPTTNPETEAKKRGYRITGGGNYAPPYKEDGSNTVKCLQCGWTGIEEDTYNHEKGFRRGIDRSCPKCKAIHYKLYYCY